MQQSCHSDLCEGSHVTHAMDSAQTAVRACHGPDAIATVYKSLCCKRAEMQMRSLCIIQGQLGCADGMADLCDMLS